MQILGVKPDPKELDAGRRVVHNSGNTVYYKASRGVSSSSYDGTLEAGDILITTQPTWFATTRSLNGTAIPGSAVLFVYDGDDADRRVGNTATDVLFAAKTEGDSQDRWQVRADGSVYAGSGSTAPTATAASGTGIANVLDYGAVGDGTTDDSVALQAALDVGGSVYVPDGVFICSALRIGSNTRLFGTGTLKLKDNASGIGTSLFPNDHHLILSNKNAKTTGVSNIEIYGLTFDGNVANNHPDEWTHAMEFWGVARAHIHDCVGQNIRGEFVCFTQSGTTAHNLDIVIENIRLNTVGEVPSGEAGGAGHARRQGIAIEDAENVLISNVFGRNIGGYVVDLEPYTSPQVVKAITVVNVVGRDCGSGVFSAVGISAAHVTDVSASNLVMTNSTYSEYSLRFRYCDRYVVTNVVCSQPSQFEGVLIENCTFGTFDAVYLDSPSYAAANTYSAVKVTDSAETAIRGCTVVAGATAYKYAVEESGASFYTSVEGNHRLDPGGSGTISVAGAYATVRHIPRSVPSVASGAAAPVLVLPVESDTVSVTGTSTITSIYTVGAWVNRKVTLVFTGVLTLTDGSNLKLAGDFVTSANDTITLTYDGTNWYEVARSVN